ncbi:hypothetical protein MJL48_34275, partial [Salmonella enterica subsp. enterica serovar Kentucky]|nr:hypothetical protein [Salmonella enterica subsp. enterica serovar Kentucky]
MFQILFDGGRGNDHGFTIIRCRGNRPGQRNCGHTKPYPNERGTYFGLHIEDSIANTRAIGAVMGGLLGGPVVGGLVGLTGGLH